MKKKKNKTTKKMVMNTEQSDRQTLSRIWGQSTQMYEGKRDIYKALGYKENLDYTDFKFMYKRQDIAGRIINAPVDEVWKTPPAALEKEGDQRETPFEKAWDEIVKRVKIWKVFSRADKMACLGRYSVIFLGFDDGGDLSQPVKKGSKLLYAKPYSEDVVKVGDLDLNTKSQNFGEPKWYSLRFTSMSSPLMDEMGIDSGAVSGMKIHPDRIIYIAYDVMENEHEGAPVLERVFNRMMDLELLAGGSAEMFWRGARPGMVAKAEADAYMGPEDVADLEAQFDQYENGLRRVLRVQGVDIKDLPPQVSSPKDHADLQVSLIAASTGIPQRVLMGSERGELASTQDEEQWAKIIDKRRTEYVEPEILTPFIERLIAVGTIPTPNSYRWVWNDLRTLNERDAAEVARIKSETLARYTMVPGAEMVVPADVFLEMFLGLNKGQIEYIREQRKAQTELTDELVEIAAGKKEEPNTGQRDSTADGMTKTQDKAVT